MDSSQDKSIDSLWNSALLHIRRGEVNEGTKHFNAAIQASLVHEGLENAIKRADDAANLLTRLDQTVHSLPFYNLSIRFEENRENWRGAAHTYVNLGTACLTCGEIETAQRSLRRAIELFKQIGDINGESVALYNLANTYLDSDESLALRYMQQVAGLAKESHSETLYAAANSTIGFLFHRQGDLARARRAFEEGLNFLDGSDLALQGMGTEQTSLVVMPLLENVTRVCLQQQDFIAAMKYCDAALGHLQESDSPQVKRKLLMLRGGICLEAGQGESSLPFLQQAKTLLETDDDLESRVEYARCLGQIAHALHETGRVADSHNTYLTAIGIARESKDIELGARLLGNFGGLLRDLGRPLEAIRYAEESLALASYRGDRSGEAKQLGNIGLAYQLMKDLTRAFEYLEAALKIQQEIGDENGQAIQLGNIGQIALSFGNPRAAIEYFHRSLALARNLGFESTESQQLGNLGMASIKLGEPDSARDYLEQALAIATRLQDLSGQALHGTHLGTALQRLGRDEEALAHWLRALSVAEKVEQPTLLYTLHGGIGAYYAAQGRLNEAIEHLKISINLRETVRARISPEHLKLAFLDVEAAVTYARLVKILLDVADAEQAYEYVRRAKSQIVTDSHSTMVHRPTTMSAGIRNEYAQLVQERRANEGRLMRATSGTERHEIMSRIGAIDKRAKDLQENESSIALGDRYSEQSNVLSNKEIQKLLSLRGGCIFAELYVLPQELVWFVMSPPQYALRVFRIPVGMEELESSYRSFLNEIAEHRGLDLVETWHRIGDRLLGWIEPDLLRVNLLCLVPHMQLHFMPISAVPFRGERLLDSAPMVIVPTSQLLRRWRESFEAVAQACLSVGYASDLGQANVIEREALVVHQIMGGELLTGVRATMKTVLAQAGDYQYIHLSCHGHVDSSNAYNSRLDLADGPLTVADVFDLRLRASLVVLSACDTGRGAWFYSDDTISLARSFLFAGARSVLVSLFPISAESSLRFMQIFYRQLKATPLNKAVALQKAQLEFRDEFRHPYHWAPFELIGDWQ